jgi:hypothetical protein
VIYFILNQLLIDDHIFLVTPVAIRRLDFATSFLNVYYFSRDSRLFVGFDASLLFDFSPEFNPFKSWVAPNSFDEVLNYSFKLRCVVPNLLVMVIAGWSRFVTRWESSLSFLKIVFRWESVRSNCLGLSRYKL